MLKALMTAVVLAALVLIGAVTTVLLLPIPPLPPSECFAFIGRDVSERVFLLNKCDGSVRVLTMPEAPPASAPVPNYSKPNI